MTQERGMFRVYRCQVCNNLGIARVNAESDVSNCSLCDVSIEHDEVMQYAVTRDEARTIAMELAILSSKRSVAKSRRGIGVKKRVFYIVESIVDMNRGRPATLKQIMNECTDASIPPERATHFLNVLKSEGLLIDTSDGIMIEGEVI